MRRQPHFVGGIAREAATQMIVDSTLAKMIQGYGHRLAERAGAGAPVGVPQELEQRRLGELRRPLGAAPVRVDGPEDHRRRLVQLFHGRRIGSLGLRKPGQAVLQCLGVFKYLAVLGAESIGDTLQQIGKGRAAVERRGRKIRAAPKGLPVRG